MKKKLLVIGALLVSLLMLCSCGKKSNKLAVREDNIRMSVGGRYTVKLTGGNTNGVKWESANPEIAVVSTDGTVSAIGSGITTVSAKNSESSVHVGVIVDGNNDYVDDDGNIIEAFDGTSDITEIEVGVKGGGKGDISVKVGDKFTLTAYTTPSDSKDRDKIEWRTSDSSVVRVNEEGVMSAVGKGKATVTAYAPNGVKGELIVRIK